MGVGYGLTRALMADVQGAQAGQADQRELERQARQDLLQQRLLEANIGDVGSQGVLRRAQAKALEAKPYTTEITDEEWAGFTADKPHLQKIPRAARVKVLEQYTGQEFKPPPVERPIAVPPGGTLMDKRGNVIGRGAPERPISLGPGATLVDPIKGTEIARGRPKELSLAQKQARDAARLGLAAIDDSEKILKQDRTADIKPWQADALQGLTDVTVPLTNYKPMKGLGTKLAQSQLTPTQKKFQQKMDQLLHNAQKAYLGSGRSIAMLQVIRDSFTPKAGQSEQEVRDNYRKARQELRVELQDIANQGEAPDGATTAPAPSAGGFVFKHTKPSGK